MPDIDLIALRAAGRELAEFTRETGQPTEINRLDLEPMANVQMIEIGEEFISITYNEKTHFRYNVKEIAHKRWECKYNDDPEFVAAIAKVINIARKNMRMLPENLACPPGCAQCCSGYEPFVSHGDAQRLATHFGISKRAFIDEYVVKRPSADGYVVGYLRKVTEAVADRCVFLKGRESGSHYCGVYTARPHDCRAFTPIGCSDVDLALPRDAPQPTGREFRPRHAAPRRGRTLVTRRKRAAAE